MLGHSRSELLGQRDRALPLQRISQHDSEMGRCGLEPKRHGRVERGSGTTGHIRVQYLLKPGDRHLSGLQRHAAQDSESSANVRFARSLDDLVKIRGRRVGRGQNPLHQRFAEQIRLDRSQVLGLPVSLLAGVEPAQEGDELPVLRPFHPCVERLSIFLRSYSAKQDQTRHCPPCAPFEVPQTQVVLLVQLLVRPRPEVLLVYHGLLQQRVSVGAPAFHGG